MFRRLFTTAFLLLVPATAMRGQDHLQKLKNAIVWVKALDQKGHALKIGSGAVIEIKAGRVRVLTAYHVVNVDSAYDIEIGTETGSVARMKIFRSNAELDFAVLEGRSDPAVTQNLRCLTIKKKSRYKPTAPIVAAGFARAFDNLSYHEGNLQNVEGSFVRYYLADGYKLQPGESGSPLLDSRLNIIGLNHGVKVGAINLAVRGDLIGNTLEQWEIQYAEPKKPLPAIGSAAVAVGLGALSLKFHANVKSDWQRYEAAITVADIQRYWNSTETNRKRGNLAAVLFYTATAFTGYQLWRHKYLPIGKSTCQIEFYPVLDENGYALNKIVAAGLRFSF